MHLLPGFVTCALLVLSFLGWGTLVSRWIFGEMRGFWPFRAAWGMAVVALFGGVLNVLGAVSVSVNLGVIGLGLVAALVLRHPGRENAREPGRAMFIAGAAVVALIVLAASFYPLRWEPNDDAIAYAMFPRKMLDTGALVEPFSNRRIVSFGGYHYLHSLVLSLVSHHELHLLDRGLATVLTGAAIVCFARQRVAAPWSIACMAGAAFMLFPPIRVNLAPTCVLSLFSLTLIETFLLTCDDARLAMWRRATLIAVVAAGLLAMRANALAIIGTLTVTLALIEAPWRRSLRLLGLIGVGSALLLAPWACALARSSGTPLFPLVKGFYNDAIPMSVAMSPAAWLGTLWENFTYSHLHILLVLAIVAFAIRAMSLPVLCFVLSALVTALATIVAFNLSGGFCMARYHGPFTTLAFVLTGASLATQASRWISAWKWPARIPRIALAGLGAAAFFLVAGFALTRGGWREKLQQHGLDPHAILASRVQNSYRAALPLRDAYAAALATIPRGSKVLSALDAPFLLSFREHDIVSIDDIGVVSPPPGLPLEGGGPALRSYLTGLGFTHLLFVKPGASTTIYSRALWQRPNIEDIWRIRAPYFLAFFDAAEALAVTHPVLHRSDAAVVVALQP